VEGRPKATHCKWCSPSAETTGFCSPEHEREYRAFWKGFAEAVGEGEKAAERRSDLRVLRGRLIGIVLLALASVALAAEPRCNRGASGFRPSTRPRSGAGHAPADQIQILQPWAVVIEPPAPRSAHSVLVGR
jgi:hypothetical protein